MKKLLFCFMIVCLYLTMAQASTRVNWMPYQELELIKDKISPMEDETNNQLDSLSFGSGDSDYTWGITFLIDGEEVTPHIKKFLWWQWVSWEIKN